jgi:hypothetical protein
MADTTYAWINITTPDGELVERIEICEGDYDFESGVHVASLGERIADVLVRMERG